MILRLLLPILVILAAVGVPALLGIGWISRDGQARRDGEVRVLREAAAAIEEARESILATAAAELRRDPDAGRRSFLAADGAVLPSLPDAPADPELRARLDRARAMGDRLAAAGDLLRAVDAYTLPLACTDDPRECGPLLLAAARAALATEALAPWGRMTLERLRDRPAPAALDPELGPVDLVAALALPADPARPVGAADMLVALDRSPAVAIAALAERFRARPGWVEDPRLDEAIAERRREEAAVRAHAEDLRAGRPALADGLLLLPLAASDAGATEIAIADLRPWLLPPAERFELASRERALPATPELWPDPFPERVDLDIDLAGVAVARHTLVDRQAPERRATIRKHATAYLALLATVLVTIALALIVSWIAIDRRARLAALRVRLLANVSHELKTPVTSIRLLGELLRDPTLPRERVAEFGALIGRESERLGRRIEEILETAWSRASRAPLPRAEVGLGAAVEEVAGRFCVRAEEGGGEVRVVVAGDPPGVETNRDALERIVENLLDNALKYGGRRSPEGDALRAPRVTVTVAGEPGVARVEVEDDGPGVPAAEGERIFEPFYRAAFDDFAVPGSGLGLSISRSFAERLGGALAYEPRTGGGSRFILTLPCRVGMGVDDGDGTG